MTDRSATSPAVPQQDTERTFDRLVDEGTQRLGRSWSGLLATGFLGGLDVGVGVLALLLLEEATHSALLGGLGLSLGFVALTLARSELFTEDFLVPVAAVVADNCDQPSWWMGHYRPGDGGVSFAACHGGRVGDVLYRPWHHVESFRSGPHRRHAHHADDPPPALHRL